MNLDLKGKNALVCGSSKGIGKAAAFELAKLGANVTLVARSVDKMAALTEQMERTSGQHHDFLAADFSNPADLKKKVRGLTAAKPIHVLVNNTGGPPSGPITEAELEEFTDAYTKHLPDRSWSSQFSLAMMPGTNIRHKRVAMPAESGRGIFFLRSSIMRSTPKLIQMQKA